MTRDGEKVVVDEDSDEIGRAPYRHVVDVFVATAPFGSTVARRRTK